MSDLGRLRRLRQLKVVIARAKAKRNAFNFSRGKHLLIAEDNRDRWRPRLMAVQRAIDEERKLS